MSTSSCNWPDSSGRTDSSRQERAAAKVLIVAGVLAANHQRIAARIQSPRTRRQQSTAHSVMPENVLSDKVYQLGQQADKRSRHPPPDGNAAVGTIRSKCANKHCPNGADCSRRCRPPLVTPMMCCAESYVGVFPAAPAGDVCKTSLRCVANGQLSSGIRGALLSLREKLIFIKASFQV